MMCRPGRLYNTALLELNGILRRFSPMTNTAPPCHSKIAVRHLAILIKFQLTVQPEHTRGGIVIMKDADMTPTFTALRSFLFWRH